MLLRLASPVLIVGLLLPLAAAGASLPYAGLVEDANVIASCGLLYDSNAKTYTPTVALQPSVVGSQQQVRFTLFDASGRQVGSQIVEVPASAAGPGPQVPLATFTFAGAFAVVHCGVQPAAVSGHGGGGTGILLGVLGVGALVGLAAGHGGGGTPNTSPGDPPTPTARPTATPVPTPTATPVPTPTPKPKRTPKLPPPTPTPPPKPTPTPTPTPIIIILRAAPGPVLADPGTLQFAGPNVSRPATVTEANFAGPYVVSSANCSGIATIAPQRSVTGAFTITALGPGSCSFAIAGAAGQSATLGVNVSRAPALGTHAHS
jgi:hypothetical protein